MIEQEVVSPDALSEPDIQWAHELASLTVRQRNMPWISYEAAFRAATISIWEMRHRLWEDRTGEKKSYIDR